ncbi:hypothetical protein [Allobranchiibius sp. GilTou73]|uniref:hypothetical protein n=1 Tax=Allobranchiibius sp. GilTou73 TaxID=2904523 RepID=UPI001F34E99F|nr:hypothetical protein [Allobranchiibius sp. GilTou73]UIJ33479.1 hypothetical protein LVQ62_09845 [Allobranchiibius sp. GilTou73]
MITADEFASLFRVLLAGLVFGAGLPALFAVGVRLLAQGHGGSAGGAFAGDAGTSGGASRGNPVALGAAYLLFGLIAVAILLGVLWITKASLKHYLGIEVF